MINWLQWHQFVLCGTIIFAVNPVSASNTSCPTWFYFNNAKQQCECGQQVEMIRCNQQEKKVSIFHGHCVTYAGQEGLYYAGLCQFVAKNNTNGLFSELPSDPDNLTEVMCGPYNRKGLLCGRCIDRYGPAVFSFESKCADCTEHSTGYNVSLYLSLQLIPITLFFMCVLFFHLNITAGPLLGYVIFCQVYMITLQHFSYLYEYSYSHVSEPIKILLQSSLTLCDLWILHYFRFVIPPLCLSTKLTGIHIQLLRLPTAIYPVVLVVTTCILMELHARNYRIIHILWKPISIPLKKLNITSVTSNAVIHTFATFIWLSASSLSYTVYTLVCKNEVFKSTDGTIYKNVLCYNPTITWFSNKHIPIFITGVAALIFLHLIPSILLFIYPTRIYGYLSQYISIRKRLAIRAFAEALQNCFKDGLNGTRDYRALAALFIIGYAVVALLDLILRVLVPLSSYLIASLVFILFSFSICCMRPCKSTIANFSLSYHTMVIGIISVVLYFWSRGHYTALLLLKWALITAPMISHTLVLMWAGYRLTRWIVSHSGYQFNCKVALTDLANAIKQYSHRRCSGYQVLPDIATR